jgi:hypothetical protein
MGAPTPPTLASPSSMAKAAWRAFPSKQVSSRVAGDSPARGQLSVARACRCRSRGGSGWPPTPCPSGRPCLTSGGAHSRPRSFLLPGTEVARGVQSACASTPRPATRLRRDRRLTWRYCRHAAMGSDSSQRGRQNGPTRPLLYLGSARRRDRPRPGRGNGRPPGARAGALARPTRERHMHEWSGHRNLRGGHAHRVRAGRASFRSGAAADATAPRACPLAGTGAL